MACVIKVIMDIDESDHPMPDMDDVIHVVDEITIGTQKRGMVSGKTSVVIIIPLPDGKAVVAETSLAAFRAAAGILSVIEE